MSLSTPKVLLAISKGFAYKNFFREKISKILYMLQISEIDVIQDEYKIARQYFEENGIKVKDLPVFQRSSTKRGISQYTHIIVFWDGDDLTQIVFWTKLLEKPLRLIPVQVTKVRNKDNDEPFDIYIGRGTQWGNPFPIGLGGVGDSRETVIEKYKDHFKENILNDPEKHKALLSLRGYRLACHCKPLACHGDVIAEYLNSYETGLLRDDDNDEMK